MAHVLGVGNQCIFWRILLVCFSELEFGELWFRTGYPTWFWIGGFSLFKDDLSRDLDCDLWIDDVGPIGF